VPGSFNFSTYWNILELVGSQQQVGDLHFVVVHFLRAFPTHCDAKGIKHVLMPLLVDIIYRRICLLDTPDIRYMRDMAGTVFEAHIS